MPLLNVSKLGVSYVRDGTQFRLLDDISFSIEAGQTFALLGESGCGKSLTALAVMQLLPQGLYCHQESEISLAGNNLLDMSEMALRPLRGSVMSLVFQEPMTALNPVKTVYQQLYEVVPKGENPLDYLSSLMEKVELPDPRRMLNAYPHELSGGQKQRIVIAMAIANKPRLLIADEPTTALDPSVQQQLLLLLKKIQHQEHIAILLISHDYAVVKQLADQVGVMYAGQMVEMNNIVGFDKAQHHPYSQRLLACTPKFGQSKGVLRPIAGEVPDPQQTRERCVFLPRCECVQASCHQEIPPWRAIADSQTYGFRCHLKQGYQSLEPEVTESTNATDQRRLSSGTCLLEVASLTVARKQKRQKCVVVDDISFSISAAETLGLIGESGCGKSTLCLSVMQLLPVSAGKINWQHQPLRSQLNRPLPIQMIFQDPASAMNPRWLVRDIILEGVRRTGTARTHDQQSRLVLKLLDQVGLPKSSVDKYPHQFSGGQRQRIVIARALAVSPQMLICDEPTSALDVSVQAQVLNLFQALQKELGVAYLFVSHDINVIYHIADRVMVMKEGKIVESGDVAQVLGQPSHPYTQQLIKASQMNH